MHLGLHLRHCQSDGRWTLDTGHHPGRFPHKPHRCAHALGFGFGGVDRERERGRASDVDVDVDVDVVVVVTKKATGEAMVAFDVATAMGCGTAEREAMATALDVANARGSIEKSALLEKGYVCVPVFFRVSACACVCICLLVSLHVAACV